MPRRRLDPWESLLHAVASLGVGQAAFRYGLNERTLARALRERRRKAFPRTFGPAKVGLLPGPSGSVVVVDADGRCMALLDGIDDLAGECDALEMIVPWGAGFVDGRRMELVSLWRDDAENLTWKIVPAAAARILEGMGGSDLDRAVVEIGSWHRSVLLGRWSRPPDVMLGDVAFAGAMGTWSDVLARSLGPEQPASPAAVRRLCADPSVGMEALFLRLEELGSHGGPARRDLA